MTTESQGGAGTGTEGAENDGGAGNHPDPERTTTATSTEEPFDKDRAMKTIQTQRESEKAAMDRAKKAEDELDKLKKASLSEEERKSAEHTEAVERAAKAEEALNAERVTSVLLVGAVKAGSTKPDAVVRLLDRSKVKGKDGQVTNLDELIDEAKKEYPELFAAGKMGSGDGGPRGGEGGVNNDITSEELLKSIPRSGM